MSEAAPPENVVAIMPDGSRIPVECVYDGIVSEEHGYHVWTAVWVLPVLPHELMIGTLPPKTAIRLRAWRAE